MDAEKISWSESNDFPSSVGDRLNLSLNPAEAMVVAHGLNLLQAKLHERRMLDGSGAGIITDRRGLGTEADIDDMLANIESAPITPRTE